MKTFAERLNEALIIRKITPAEIAKRTGIYESTLSNYRKGKYAPKQDKLETLARVLDVSIPWLMGADVDVGRFDAPIRNESAVVLDSVKFYPVPQFLSVAAGFGAEAESQVAGYTMLPFLSQYEAAQSMSLKVKGDSMFPKIEDGDWIIVRKVSSVDPGSLAVVMIDRTDFVVKKVNYGSDWVELVSINPMYPPRRFEGAELQRLEVVGLVTKIIKEV